VIAHLAYRERREGRDDPTSGLAALPGIDELDALFGREGLSRQVREKVAREVRWSADALRGEGYEVLMRHVREGGSQIGMWRTVLRLVRFGNPVRALRLAAALLASRRLEARAG
jgi:hypothetical protein